MASPRSESAFVNVLLVDDDEDDYVLTRDLLAEIKDGGYLLDWKSDYDESLTAICSGAYDVILLDYRLGEKSGLDLLAEARTLGCEAPVIVLTGLSDAEIDLAAMHRGAADYVEKSRLDRTLLDRMIRYSVQQRQIEVELERRVKQRTEELDQANATLKDNDRRKDEFLATLAHELRNPLAPIRNALEIMRLSDDRPEAVRCARGIIDRQVTTLVRLIDDLLDVSRITRGKIRLNTEPLELSEIVESAIEQSKPLLDKAGQKLTVKLPDEPIRVKGDRVRLSQVFTNLLNNAAKFSEAGGGVMVTAACEEQTAVVLVTDTGIGIESDLLDHIFEPFVQIGRVVKGTQDGLGIGLNLVHSLVTLHGGRVFARSSGLGEGAEFEVRLPLAD